MGVLFQKNISNLFTLLGPLLISCMKGCNTTIKQEIKWLTSCFIVWFAFVSGLSLFWSSLWSGTYILTYKSEVSTESPIIIEVESEECSIMLLTLSDRMQHNHEKVGQTTHLQIHCLVCSGLWTFSFLKHLLEWYLCLTNC